MYKENDYVPNSTILDGFYFIKGSLLNYCLIIVFFRFQRPHPCTEHLSSPGAHMYAVHVFTHFQCLSSLVHFSLSLGANDFYTFDQSIAQVCIHLYIFDSLQYVYIQR